MLQSSNALLFHVKPRTLRFHVERRVKSAARHVDQGIRCHCYRRRSCRYRGGPGTGAFLAGPILGGVENYEGGRAGDPAAVTLAARLGEFKPPVGLLTTGAPPRLAAPNTPSSMH